MFFVVAAAIVILYAGLYYIADPADNRRGRSVTDATEASTVETVSVLRNLALGCALFVAFDGLVFHSGLYRSILKPSSYAGNISRSVANENRRTLSGATEVLVIGDSRIAMGFSAVLANNATRPMGVRFTKLAIGGTDARVWFYLLREIDPSAERYDAIVVPLQPDNSLTSRKPYDDRSIDIVQAAPLLRYADAYSFASSFGEWKNQARAFVACLLRGSAFQADLQDLLQHPAARLAAQRTKEVEVDLLRRPPLRGLSYDRRRRRIIFPSGLTKFQKVTIGQSARFAREGPRWDGKSAVWFTRIMERYSKSKTKIIFVQLPRGPLASVFKVQAGQAATPFCRPGAVMPAYHFADLETPEYFVDGFHLNLKGLRQFTQRLAEEVVARLGKSGASGEETTSANSPGT